MHPLDRINMQPKDRPNIWAFLGTSLPLSSPPAQSFSLPLSESILPPTASCPHPSFLPGPVYLDSRHSHIAIFPLGRRLSLPRRPGVCGPGSQSLQVSQKTQLNPLPSASGRRRHSSGGILGHLSGPSSQVSWRWGYSTRGEGAYPGPPAPTCICPTIGSPGPVGPGSRGRPAARSTPIFPSLLSPLWLTRGSHSRQPSPALGKGKKELRSRAGSRAGSEQGNVSLPRRLHSFFTAPLRSLGPPLFFEHFWPGHSTNQDSACPRGPPVPSQTHTAGSK